MKTRVFKIQFSEYIPETLSTETLYISMECAIASHKCACGCGQEVVTPFSPTDWKLTYDGESISLSPSIGNWSYPCRAHYFIRNNRVIWASDMSQEAIQLGRLGDRRRKAIHYNQEIDEIPTNTESGVMSGGILNAIARFFGFKK
ncbi:hypothetical protein LJC59_02960 [Desulfovibrio sp. OttesenSCG-928-A18]|nr:hypothetical protein [Desulfovibrio sp. OttesenSCG-928-A18]